MAALNEADQLRIARVRAVFNAMKDEGVDRAATLTLAFFASEQSETTDWHARIVNDQLQLDRNRS